MGDGDARSFFFLLHSFPLPPLACPGVIKHPGRPKEEERIRGSLLPISCLKLLYCGRTKKLVGVAAADKYFRQVSPKKREGRAESWLSSPIEVHFSFRSKSGYKGQTKRCRCSYGPPSLSQEEEEFS